MHWQCPWDSKKGGSLSCRVGGWVGWLSTTLMIKTRHLSERGGHGKE